MIDLEARDGVAWLHLNRPQALNALNRPLTAALDRALDEIAAREDLRVLVVSGRGRAFCAGNDIAEMATLSGDEAVALATAQAALMERFGRLPQVTIAAVDGYALGGGCMLAVAQDLRIASDRARFGLPEVTLGFNPAYGIARLLDVVGGGVARDLLLTGRTVRAQEALRLGLVNRVVAAPTLCARRRPCGRRRSRGHRVTGWRPPSRSWPTCAPAISAVSQRPTPPPSAPPRPRPASRPSSSAEAPLGLAAAPMIPVAQATRALPIAGGRGDLPSRSSGQVEIDGNEAAAQRVDAETELLESGGAEERRAGRRPHQHGGDGAAALTLHLDLGDHPLLDTPIRQDDPLRANGIVSQRFHERARKHGVGGAGVDERVDAPDRAAAARVKNELDSELAHRADSHPPCRPSQYVSDGRPPPRTGWTAAPRALISGR